ncbi:50S ribosomal protein L17 [Patescibacteria group bacterium]|nr:50S ribosomal protein L17 [Patescibacteria group bacterium]
MRHKVKTKRLNRDLDHKKALKRNLADQLVLHEKIETTLVKAKYVKPYVEKLITKAKNKTGSETEKFNTVKYLRKKLYSEQAIRKVIEDLSSRYKDRNGGYTRIVKTRNRDGDKALMGRIELITEKKDKARKSEKVTRDKVKEDEVKVEENTKDE